jgi:Tol biopolymer transport system component
VKRTTILLALAWSLSVVACSSDRLHPCTVETAPNYDGWRGKMALAFMPATQADECILLLDADRRSATAFSWSGLPAYWNRWIALSPDAAQIAFAGMFQLAEPYRLGTATRDGGDLQAVGPTDLRNFDPVWDPGGQSLVFVGDPQERVGFTVYRVGLDGTDLTALPMTSAGRVALSPDGQRIAFADGGIVVSDTARQERVQLTMMPGDAAQYGPWWSPEGGSISYIERRGPNDSVGMQPPYTFDIRVVGADGTGDRLVHRIEMQSWLTDDVYAIWSPDGTQIAANDGNSVVVIDAATGEIVTTVIGPRDLGYGPPSWVQ